jgi:hypothetical protein
MGITGYCRAEFAGESSFTMRSIWRSSWSHFGEVRKVEAQQSTSEPSVVVTRASIVAQAVCSRCVAERFYELKSIWSETGPVYELAGQVLSNSSTVCTMRSLSRQVTCMVAKSPSREAVAHLAALGVERVVWPEHQLVLGFALAVVLR